MLENGTPNLAGSRARVASLVDVALPKQLGQDAQYQMQKHRTRSNCSHGALQVFLLRQIRITLALQIPFLVMLREFIVLQFIYTTAILLQLILSEYSNAGVFVLNPYPKKKPILIQLITQHTHQSQCFSCKK